MRLKDVDYIDNLLYLEQKRLESNDDKTWERNRKYYRGIAFARRILEDAPTVEANKWHDLRKDPTDLPIIDGNVIICYVWKGGFTGTIYKDYSIAFFNGKVFKYLNSDINILEGFKIIAWKKIEIIPFEVENDEIL